MSKYTQADKVAAQNLVKLLRRAKFDEVAGMEVLAFGQCYDWLGSILRRIEKDLNPDPIAQASPEAAASEEQPKKKSKKRKARKKKNVG